MPIVLRNSDSLDSYWEELVYTEARLLAAGHTSHATAIAKRIKALDALQAAQKGHWRREIVAQAHVDAVDDDLDDRVEGVARELTYLDKGRKTSRFRQYFKGTVSAIVRLGLESQLGVVRPFVAMLAKEPEKALKDHGKALSGIVKNGDKAVEERASAATDRAAHRARQILSFVDDLNAARLTLHAELTIHAAKEKLPRDYADRFFRRPTRTAKAVTPTDPDPTPTK